MPSLPYRAITESGAVLEVSLPLHEHTASPMRVQQLLTALEETLTREIHVLGTTSNGDILQALAMALAVRAGLVEAAPGPALGLARDLVATATAAVATAALVRLPAGHA
jgi:uncharacterized protein YgbK (DUF1537 family)